MNFKICIFTFSVLSLMSFPVKSNYVYLGQIVLNEGDRHSFRMDLPKSEHWEVELTGLHRGHEIKDIKIEYDYRFEGGLGEPKDNVDFRVRNGLSGKIGFHEYLIWRSGGRLFAILKNPSATVLHFEALVNKRPSNLNRKSVRVIFSNPRLTISMRREKHSWTPFDQDFEYWTEEYDLSKRGRIKGKALHVDSWDDIATNLRQVIYINNTQ